MTFKVTLMVSAEAATKLGEYQIAPVQDQKCQIGVHSAVLDTPKRKFRLEGAMGELGYGWVKVNQASVIDGLAVPNVGVTSSEARKKTGKESAPAGIFGKLPTSLIGSQTVGPLVNGYHNLIGKDIVFRAKGKHALNAILHRMGELTHVKIRCGIFPGMEIERFVKSPDGGGDDQISTTARERDISRMPYYLYVYEETKGSMHFDNILFSVATKVGFMAGGIGSAAPGSTGFYGLTAHNAFDLGDGIVKGKELKEHWTQERMNKADKKEEELKTALKADKVILLITGKDLKQHYSLAKHSRTHNLPELAKDVIDEVKELYKNV